MKKIGLIMGFTKIKYHPKKLDLAEEIEIALFLILKLSSKIELYV